MREMKSEMLKRIEVTYEKIDFCFPVAKTVCQQSGVMGIHLGPI